MNRTGRWALIIGMILAILAGFFAIPWLAIILFVLGLVVGFLNISGEEAVSFLIAVIALMLVGIITIQGFAFLGVTISDWIQTVFGNFMAFLAPAALIVAIKVVLTVVGAEKK